MYTNKLRTATDDERRDALLHGREINVNLAAVFSDLKDGHYEGLQQKLDEVQRNVIGLQAYLSAIIAPTCYGQFFICERDTDTRAFKLTSHSRTSSYRFERGSEGVSRSGAVRGYPPAPGPRGPRGPRAVLPSVSLLPEVSQLI